MNSLLWRILATGLLLAACLVQNGCATYHAAPLTDESVWEELRPPTSDAVRMAVAQLDHPFLKPLVFDLSDGLSPDEAALLAVVANPALRAARTQRGLSRAALLTAGVLPNPQLAASADFPVNDSTGAATALTLGFSIDLNTFFTRGAEVRSAQAALASVDLGIAWQEWQVAQQARLQVYRTIYLSRQAALAEEAEDALAQNLSVLTRAAALHLVTEVDRATADDAYRTTRGLRLDLDYQRDSTRLGLNHLLGLPPDADIALQASHVPFATALDTLHAGADTTALTLAAVDTTAFALPAFPSADSLLATLQKRRLDLIALQMGYTSQEEALRIAVLNQFPTINIGLNRATNDAKLLTLGPAVSVSLPFFDRNQGAIATARATRAQLRQEYLSRVFDARADVSSLLLEIGNTLAQLRNAEMVLPSQRHLVTIYGEALRLGNADVLTYYTTRTDLMNKEVEVVKLRQTLAELVVALETTTGRFYTFEATASPIR